MGRASTFEYDRHGRLVTEARPWFGKRTIGYDRHGRAAREATEGGPSTTRTYDAAGRLATVETTSAAPFLPVAPHVYGYDPGTRAQSVTVGAGATSTLRHDSLGRLVSDATGAVVAARSFDDLDGHIRITTPTGRTERHELDLLGRLTRVVLESAGTSAAAAHAGAAESVLYERTYAGDSRIATEVSQGVTMRRLYDDAGRLASVAATDASDEELWAEFLYRDPAGRLRGVWRRSPANVGTVYRYDGAGRLVEVRRGEAELTDPWAPTQADQNARVAALELALASTTLVHAFSLRADDSRSRERVNGADRTWEHDARGRPVRRSSTTMTHDAVGNRVATGTRTRTYDARGRLARTAVSRIVSESRTYDGWGRWTGGHRAGNRYSHTWFGADRLSTSALSSFTEWTSVPGRLDAVLATSNTGRRFVGGDGGGNRVAAFASGALAQRFDYGALGDAKAFDAAGTAEPVDATSTGLGPVFGGLDWSSPGACYTAAARVYEPDVGLWTQPDPAGPVDSWYPYVHSGHAWTNYVDPSGLAAQVLAKGEPGNWAPGAGSELEQGWAEGWSHIAELAATPGSATSHGLGPLDRRTSDSGAAGRSRTAFAGVLMGGESRTNPSIHRSLSEGASEGTETGVGLLSTLTGGRELTRGLAADALLNRRFVLFQPPRGSTQLALRDMAAGRVARNTGRPVGVDILRLDAPHNGAPFPHINVASLGELDPHYPVSPRLLRAGTRLGRFAVMSRRALAPVALGLDALSIADAVRADGGLGHETVRAATSIAAGWSGAAVGAKIGAQGGFIVGAWGGSLLPGIGNVAGGAVGAFTGGLIGGVGGSFAGVWGAGRWLED